MNEPSDQLRQVRSSADVLSSCLMILACVLAGAGLLAGCAHLVLTAVDGDVTLRHLLQAGGWLLLGAALAAFSWSISWLVRRQRETAAVLQRLQDAVEGTAIASPAAAARDGEAAREHESLRRIFDELAAINANLLLSPAQREAKARQQLAKAGELLVMEVEQAIEADDFAEAERVLARLAAELPDSQRQHDLRARLSEARAAAEMEDVSKGVAAAAEMMAASRFDRAEKLAEDLLNRHPTAPEAIALVDHVRREASTFVTENRRRLFARIDRDVEARDWRTALKGAQEFLDSYPDCQEADLIRAQMPTLADNAKMEEARQLRNDVLDMIERRRFTEAVKSAKELIQSFPETKAAGELRRQLPQLEKLANEGEDNK